jgi:hypothetical protein
MAVLVDLARLEMPVSGLLVLAKTVGNFEIFQDRFRQLLG